MLGLMFYGLVIAGLVGGIIFAAMYFLHDDYTLTKDEWPILAGVLVALVALTSLIGYKVAVSDNLTYHEFWGGYELHVAKQVYYCRESSTDGGYTGGCVNYYDGDSYEVWVESQSCTTDRKGREHCVDTSHWVTKYRQIPYTTTETSYIVDTTLGDFTIGYHWLPSNPSQHRIYPRSSWLESIPSGLSSGIPSFWLAAKNRIESGNPGPVTAEKNYQNYILASQETILHKYSPWIAQYQKANLLPDINHSVYDFYYLNRFYAVGGVNPGDISAWQLAMNKFDAAFGATLQGDLYLVAVPASVVTDPHQYVMSLAAYWQSRKFGKYALSKNGVIVVVGVNPSNTVAWAESTTGMPSGNSMMLLDIHNQLPGCEFTPQAILGNPVASVESDAKTGYKVTLSGNDAALAKIIWGPDAFVRVHMGKKSSTSGYMYLKGQIVPSFWQEFWILITIAVLSGIAWAVALAYGVPAYQNYRRNR